MTDKTGTSHASAAADVGFKQQNEVSRANAVQSQLYHSIKQIAIVAAANTQGTAPVYIRARER